MTNYIEAFSDTLLSDFHKDALGFRPRDGYPMWMTKFEVDAEYERLGKIMRENEEIQRRAEDRNLADWEKFIAGLQEMHGIDRETAVRWDLDGHDVTLRCEQDLEHFFWEKGLGWVDINRLVKDFRHLIIKE